MTMLRIGMVGTGHIAQVHVRALAHIPNVRVTALFDTVPEKAARMARELNAVMHPNLDAMLREVDVIYIGTPPRFHREAAIAALEAGVHVFCEKPLAASVEDTEAIQRAAEKADVLFTVGFNFRFDPVFRCFRELLTSGKLGDISSYRSVRALWSPHDPPNWRTDPRFLCGMAIESLSHDFDLMRWFAGDAVTVMGRVATSRPDLEGYDNIVHALMTLNSGATANIHASWASHVSTHQVAVIGTRGSALCEGGHIRWRTETEPSEQTTTPERENSTGYQRESEHFVDCIRAGRQPMVSVHDGVATVRISHAVLRSSQEGRLVQLCALH